MSIGPGEAVIDPRGVPDVVIEPCDDLPAVVLSEAYAWGPDSPDQEGEVRVRLKYRGGARRCWPISVLRPFAEKIR